MCEGKSSLTPWNAEGYIDKTAYQAIKNTESEGKRMEQQVAKGEVWTIEQTNGYPATVLIINTFEGYAAALILKDKQPRKKDSRNGYRGS